MVGGTDGRDGDSDAAGGLIDGTTAARSAAAGHDLRLAVARFDTATALAAAGDAVVTGPTGTNVGDLLVATFAGPARAK
jgi:hydroxypyruvate reductase